MTEVNEVRNMAFLSTLRSILKRVFSRPSPNAAKILYECSREVHGLEYQAASTDTGHERADQPPPQRMSATRETTVHLSELRQLAKEMFAESNPGSAHLLCAWAAHDSDGQLSALLAHAGADKASVSEALQPLLNERVEQDSDLLSTCICSSRGPANGRHLLQCLCSATCHPATEVLRSTGLDLARLKQRLTEPRRPVPCGLQQSPVRSGRKSAFLARYGRDLTALAEAGEFDGLCDRPREIARIEKTLQRMSKPNCVLTGGAGTGKTALVELLARRIVCGEIAHPLCDMRVYEFRMSELVAGTKYRGEFETRIEELVKAIEAEDNLILFVDEMHLLWGAGSTEGAPLDAANILKPALGRGRLRMIGATTTEEYNRYIAKDAALARRFQEIRLHAPDMKLLYQMVRAQASLLSEHHNVLIRDATVHAAIKLTDRYVVARAQPDKACELLDDACVAATGNSAGTVSRDTLLEVLAERTGFPVGQLTDDDRGRMRTLSEELKKRIIGQDRAVDAVSATLIQRRQDLGPESRNLGAFLFAGSTGVGKTELARTIAEVFFDRHDALLHLDMAEYSLATAVHKLVGAPAGYMGCESAGTLTAWLQSDGCGVILFDEIEKAHEEVWRMLLGLLDEGRIRGGNGGLFDTRQCVVVLTTNALTPDDMQAGTFGFAGQTEEASPIPLLSRHFSQEFLARLDEAVLFEPLGDRELAAIARLRIRVALDRLRQRGVRVVCNEERLVRFLVGQIDNRDHGARGVAALIERKLVQPVSFLLLNHEAREDVRVKLGDKFFESGLPEIG